MTQQFQYDVDRLITEIRIFLDSDTEPGAKITRTAEEFAAACELTNELLGHCAQLLDQSLKVEAVEYSKQFEPDLLVLYNKLQIPDTSGDRISEWLALVVEYGLPRPPRLFEKGWRELFEADKGVIEVRNLLIKHRLLALRRGSYRERLQVLRQLLQHDPAHRGWLQDITEFEQMRHLQMRDELQRAVESGDDLAILGLSQEVLEPETAWQTEVDPILIEQLHVQRARIEKEQKAADRKELADRLTKIIGQMRTTLEAGDMPAILGAWKDWEAIGEKHLKQLRGDSLKVVERMRREVKRYYDEQAAITEWKKQCDRLRKMIASGDADKHPAAQALAEGLRQGRGLPPDLDSAVSEWGARLLANERIQRNTTLIAVCVVAILLFGGVGLIFWFAKSNAYATKQLEEFQRLVANETPEGIRQANDYRKQLSPSLLSRDGFRGAVAQLDHRVQQLNLLDELEAAVQVAEGGKASANTSKTLQQKFQSVESKVELPSLRENIESLRHRITTLTERWGDEEEFQRLLKLAQSELQSAEKGTFTTVEKAIKTARNAASTDVQKQLVAELDAEFQEKQQAMAVASSRQRFESRLKTVETDAAKAIATSNQYDWRELTPEQRQTHEAVLKPIETTLATVKSLQSEGKPLMAGNNPDAPAFVNKLNTLSQSLEQERQRLLTLAPCAAALDELRGVIRRGLDETELSRYEEKLTAVRDTVKRLPSKDEKTQTLLSQLTQSLGEFSESKRIVHVSVSRLNWIQLTENPRLARERLQELSAVPEAEWPALQRGRLRDYLQIIANRDSAEVLPDKSADPTGELVRLLNWLTQPQQQRSGLLEKPAFTKLWSVTLAQGGLRTYYGDAPDARDRLKSRTGTLEVEALQLEVLSVPKTAEFKSTADVAALALIVETETRRIRQAECQKWEESWENVLDRVLAETNPGHEIFRAALAWQVFSTAWRGSPLWQQALGPYADWAKEVGFKPQFPFWNPGFPESPDSQIKKAQEMITRLREKRPSASMLMSLREQVRTELAKSLPLLDVPVGEIWSDRKQSRVLLTPQLVSSSEPPDLRVLVPQGTTKRWSSVATIQGGKAFERFEDSDAEMCGRLVFARVRAENFRP